MRIAVYILAVLVFAAGLILDTGALLALIGGALWSHRLIVGGVVILVVAAGVGWRRLPTRRPVKVAARGKTAQRTSGARQKPTAKGRGQPKSKKRARGR
jgi:type VI protein secretion system component VasK